MAGVLQKLDDTENLVLGMTAGVCAKLVNYPLLVWKNQTQQGLKLEFNPRRLYRGLPVACLNLGGATALQFGLSGFFQKYFTGGVDRKLTINEEISSSFLGGLLSGVPCSVWELTMIQQQRFGGGILGTPMRIIREFGVLNICRGMLPTCGREAIFTMGMLGVCPVINEQVQKLDCDKNISLAIGALLGSTFSATLTHPLDTMKTCMQGDVARENWGTMTQTGQLLVEQNGAVGLFKGLGYRIGLIATTFFLVNNFKAPLAMCLFPHHFQEN